MKTKSLAHGRLPWLGTIIIASTAPCWALEAPDDNSPAPPQDTGWPREMVFKKAKLTCYQPQIEEWENYRKLHARLAISLTPSGGDPVLGVAEVIGETTTDQDTRTVVIRNIQIVSSRFPSAKDEDAIRLEALLKENFAAAPLTVSLDRLLAGLKLAEGAADTVEVKMDPPPIFISSTPAMMLTVEGKPVLAPAEKTGLKFLVNTNWDVLFDEAAGTYYLLSGDEWLSAKNLAGPWNLAESLPEAVSQLPDDDTWKHVKDETPWTIRKGMIVPKIFYSDKPAELIIFQGEPVWEKIEGTGLSWADNTESRVFQNSDGTIYFLVSGRWFKTPRLGDNWSYAGNDLPKDFSNIPEDGPCGDVLASVPGTTEAEDAVVLASVPVEAVVKIKDAEAKAKVSYHGDPEFKDIDGTRLKYASNTSSDVVECADKYYLCQDAVWFVSATASGPWVICADVPAAVYTIPPSSPVYRVTYVHVEDGDRDDDQVTCSYTAGYFGAFIAGLALGDCLVWGTGYYYPPYVSWGPYPAYYPYHYSYGCAAAYNPWTGGYAVGDRFYGPYASAGRAAWYNPATGRYGRAAQISGPYGTRTVAGAYNPRTGNGWATRQGNNGYAQWGTSAATRGNKWIQSAHVATPNGGAAAWRGSDGAGTFHWSDEGHGGMAVHNGDFYAGHDGNVYRKDDGQWSKWQDGGWQPAGHDNNGINPQRPDPNHGPGPNPPPRPKPPGPKPDNDRNGFISGQTRHTPAGYNGGTRPGENGGGERKEIPDNRPNPPADRPGAGGSGERKPDGPQRRTTDPDEVQSRLNRDSAARDRGEERSRQFQPQGGGGGGFSGGSGSQRGGGFGGGGGGGFRRGGGGGGFHRR